MRPAASRSGLADLALAADGGVHGVPGIWRPAEAEGLDGLVGEAAIVQVVERRLARGVLGEDRVVERDGTVEGVTDALALGILAGGALAELDAGSPRQRPKRRGEVHAVPLHDEVEDVPAAATAEAVPTLTRGRDRERGGLLTMERAEALEDGPGLLQLDGLADDLDDVQLLLDACGDAD